MTRGQESKPFIVSDAWAGMGVCECHKRILPVLGLPHGARSAMRKADGETRHEHNGEREESHYGKAVTEICTPQRSP